MFSSSFNYSVLKRVCVFPLPTWILISEVRWLKLFLKFLVVSIDLKPEGDRTSSIRPRGGASIDLLCTK